MQAQQEPAKTTISELKVATYAPFHYAAKTLFPRDLAAIYPVEQAPTQRVVPLIIGGTFFLFLLGLALAMIRRRPRLAFGILASGVILAPVSGALTVGYSFAADRYSYLPTAILFAGIASVLSQYIREVSRARELILRSCFVFLIATYALVTIAIAPYWSNSVALWRRVLVVYPESVDAKRHLALAWSTKAQAALKSGDTKTYERHVKDALRIFPADLGALRFKVGELLADGQIDWADSLLQRALQTPGLGHMSKTYALGMKGVIAHSRGESALADSLIRDAFIPWGHEPTSAESQFLGWLASTVGDTSLAIDYYQRALDDEPLSETALRNLARLYAVTGNHYNAFLLFLRLTEICPDDSLARHNARVAAQKAMSDADK